jgi:hypothetical protein
MMKLKRIRWTGNVAHMVEIRNACSILIGNPEMNRPLGRPVCRWEGNIKMDIREAGWEVVDWMQLVLDRDQWRTVVNTVMNLRVP